MIDFVKSVLGMSLSTTRVVLIFAALLLSFLILGRYPIEYERVTYEVRDYIKITKTDIITVQTEIEKNGGLKVKTTTKTYYTKVDETPHIPT